MLTSGKRFQFEGQGDSSSHDEPELCSTNEPSADEMKSNPLINSVVITRIFDFCDLGDLLEYRLVCKEWHSASKPRVRNEMFVNITADPDKTLNWSTFPQEFNSVGAPYRNFRVCKMDFVISPSPSTEELPKCNSRVKALAEETNTSVEQIHRNMEHFWEAHGPLMHKLEIIDFSVFSVDAFKKALFRQTPNLEELKIESFDYQFLQSEDNLLRHDDNDVGIVQSNLKSLSVQLREEPGPIEWTYMFLLFPKIQKLNLHLGNSDAIIELHHVCASLDQIPLKELVLSGVTEGLFTPIKNFFQLPKLKLTKLEMQPDVWNNEDERSIFQVALRTHRNTLKELVVWSYWFDTDYDPLELNNNFPFRREPFLQLTTLVMNGHMFRTFRCLEQMPNLEILRLCIYDNSEAVEVVDFEIYKRDLDIMILNQTRMTFLKTFEFKGKRLSGGEMERLVKFMPNVKDFQGEIDVSALQVIYKNWTMLRVLGIDVDCSIDDEALTGIKEGCGDMRHPNLTNLRDLRELKIWNGNQIGDASIQNAILKMRYLISVYAQLSPETSQNVLDGLRKRFPPGVEIYRVNPNF